MNIKNLKKIIHNIWLIVIAIIFTLNGCVQNKKSQKNTKKIKTNIQIDTQKNITINTVNTQKIEKEKDVITVWVHGTRSIHLQDHIFKVFFYRKMGLCSISEYLEKHNLRKFAKIMVDQNTHRFTFDNFYFFGWNGNLNHQQRKFAAKKLHIDLLNLINVYKTTHGTIPKIRLITHSHGGNVALNFGKINDKAIDKINIHELILLACPVQKKTSKLIASQTFEKIYSLYSGFDMIQIIDPQGLHDFMEHDKKRSKKPLFSERTFKPQENLSQIKLKVNGRGIMHVEFLITKFARLLPYILQEIDIWEKEKLHNALESECKKGKQLKVFIKNNILTFNRKNLKK